MVGTDLIALLPLRINQMFALGGNYQLLLFSIFKAEQLKFGEVYSFLVNFDQLLM